MMNITVRSLSSDVLLVVLPLHSSVADLQREIYAAWPETPIGCLCVRPVRQEDEDAVLDHELALLRMGLTLVDVVPNEDEFALEDGMEVFAFVDESLVWAHLTYYGGSYMPSESVFAGMTVQSTFVIEFHRSRDMPTDPPLAKINLTSQNNRWADMRTFATCGRRYGVKWSPNTYRPGPHTIWHATIADCVLASPLNVPRSPAILADIQRQWDVRERERERKRQLENQNYNW